jgi:hypothetical protein
MKASAMMKGLLKEDWSIDGRVDLTKACADADWHLATAIENLQAQGIGREDAEAFANFRFTVASGEDAQDMLTEEQDARLSEETVAS